MSPRIAGSKPSWLLWVNTILTAAAAFVGTRLWDKIDRMSLQQAHYEEKVDHLIKAQESLGRTQSNMAREHRTLFEHLEKLEKK